PGDVHASPALRRHLAGVLLARSLAALGGRGVEDTVAISLTLNRAAGRRPGQPRPSLGGFPRFQPQVTGSHGGWERGRCGACAVRARCAWTERSCAAASCSPCNATGAVWIPLKE